MSLNPKLWGREMWHTLYAIAIGYPEKPDSLQIMAAKKFVTSLCYLIPCEECREHYNSYLKQDPIYPYLRDSSTLVIYINNLHNYINTLLNKPEITLDEISASFDVEIEMPSTPIQRGERMIRIKTKNCKNCGKSQSNKTS